MLASYGRLSDDQTAVLAKRIEDRVVHDLGAGHCALALRLARLGAKKVIAVDKKPMPTVDDPRVETRQGFYGSVATDTIDVGFVSWPETKESIVLLQLLQHAVSVVYLGKNTDSTACGWPALFKSFLDRKVLAYVPERPNTLIVYGEKLKRPRKPRGEEHAAISATAQARPLKFEEVEETEYE